MRQEAVRQALERAVVDLSECLTDRGTRDLRATRLADMEDELCTLADQMVLQLMPALLHRQAQQVADADVCPRCGGALDEQPDQTRLLQTRRGRVHWKQPVRRCPACRRDFFPSGQGAGL